MDPTPPVNAHRLNPVDGRLRRLSLRLLPPRCLLCRAPGAAGRELCADCARDLPWNRACCARCALPLPPVDTATATDARICGHCQQHPPGFDRLIAPFRYAYPLDGLVTRFKFRHDLAAGALLADLMAERLAAADLARPDQLVPVPLHVRRLQERGYNQSLELAKRLALALGLPIDPSALHRQRATAAQSELDAAERHRNVRDAFAADPARVRGGHVALVDDVATTGATVEECAHALRMAGARAVSVWVIARAPAPAD
jgi:ComF family protein